MLSRDKLFDRALFSYLNRLKRRPLLRSQAARHESQKFPCPRRTALQFEMWRLLPVRSPAKKSKKLSLVRAASSPPEMQTLDRSKRLASSLGPALRSSSSWRAVASDRDWDIAAVPRRDVERQSLPKADVNSSGAKRGRWGLTGKSPFQMPMRLSRPSVIDPEFGLCVPEGVDFAGR